MSGWESLRENLLELIDVPLLKVEQPTVFQEHVGFARLVARREDLYATDAEAAGEVARRLGEAVSPAQAVATQKVIREIAVSDVEPRGRVEVHERVPHPERLLAQPPATLGVP